jgi:hypothetical protein
VSTALPALRAYAHVASLAATPDEFVAALDHALRGRGPALATRLAVAREHTYERRTGRMLELLEAR